MQFKPITAIIVLLLLSASLVVSGCTTSTTSNTNQTPSTSTAAAHDAFLEKYLAAYKDTQYSNQSRQVKAWELEWVNSTSAHLQYTVLTKPSNYTNLTGAYDVTFTVFSTTQDATNYLNAMNKTDYSLASMVYTDSPGGVAYKNVTGQAPQIYKYYQLDTLSARKEIHQADNIIYVGTTKGLS
jgi:hypothetical protein